MRTIHLMFLGSLLLSHHAFSLCRARVSGKVSDEIGATVPNASVSFVKDDSTPARKALNWFETDDHGNFDAVLDLEQQSYWIIQAKKEDAGYPDPTLAFYNNRAPRLVELDCGVSLKNLVVVLGPKAAYITKLTVVNESTGQPVLNASITLRRLTSPLPQVPSPFLTTSTVLASSSQQNPGLAVPSNVKVTYVISAPGYVTAKIKTLRLPPLKKTSISVVLKPLSATSGE